MAKRKTNSAARKREAPVAQKRKNSALQKKMKREENSATKNSLATSVEKIPIIKRETIVPYLIALILLVAASLVVIVYKSYAWPAFFALLLYIGFYNGHNYLHKIIQNSRLRRYAHGLSSLIATLLVIILILLPTIVVIQQLLLELYRLIADLRLLFSNNQFLITLQKFPLLIDVFTARPFFWISIYDTLAEIVAKYGDYFDTANIGSWVGNLFSIVSGSLGFTFSLGFNLLLAIVILYFLFRDGPFFYMALKRALPFSSEITDSLATRMRELTSTVLKGNIFISILQGSLLALGLFICGFQSYVVYGAVAAIFSLVPVIGTAVVWLPASLYLALIEKSYSLALFLSIYGLSMFLILENILKPKLLNEKLGIHPLFIFFAILGGIVEFGITGVILGPLFVTLFATIWKFYHIWDPANPKAGSQLEG